MNLNEKKILVTGKGYVGSFINIYLRINQVNDFESLNRKDFKNTNTLRKKLKNKEVIFHNAASVKKDDTVINENSDITQSLLTSLDLKSIKLFILFGSTHESNSTPYGISKKTSYLKIKSYLKKNNICFHKYTIPNIYGCYYRPYHNSFFSTLIYEFVKNKNLNNIKNLENNSKLELVFINDLLNLIFKNIKSNSKININTRIVVKKISLKETINLLNRIFFKLEKGNYDSSNQLEKNLLNVIFSYFEILNLNFKNSNHIKDKRGYLYELHRSKGFSHIFISSSKSGAIRGNHFHTNKYEIFHIIKGEAKVLCHNLITNVRKNYILKKNKEKLIIPPYVNHTFVAKKNDTIGVFFSSEIYNSKMPDTYIYEK